MIRIRIPELEIKSMRFLLKAEPYEKLILADFLVHRKFHQLDQLIVKPDLHFRDIRILVPRPTENASKRARRRAVSTGGDFAGSMI